MWMMTTARYMRRFCFAECLALPASKRHWRDRTGDPELRDVDGSDRRDVLHNDRLHATWSLPPQDLRLEPHANAKTL